MLKTNERTNKLKNFMETYKEEKDIHDTYNMYTNI